MSVRLNKLLAQRGIGARRKCDLLITQGAVQVNGRVVTELGTKVEPERDRILVHGKPIPGPTQHRYFALHKPVGIITTLDDPEGRPTIKDLLPTGPRLFPVGRLDADTSGLLLLTNDGELAHRLMHPRYGVVKRYRVRLDHPPSPGQLRALREGVEFEPGVVSSPASVVVQSHEPGGALLSIEIHEGRYRQVRRMCEAVGLTVLGLHRSAYGPIRLGQMERGMWRALSDDEIEALRAASARPVPRMRPHRGRTARPTFRDERAGAPERAARGGAAAAPRAARAPVSAPRAAARPARAFGPGAGRPPRPERPTVGASPRTERPPRRYEGTAPRAERAPRQAEGGVARAERAPRRFEGTAPRAERAPRRFEGTSSRTEGSPRRFEGSAPRGERPPRRSEGSAPRSERPPRRFEGGAPRTERPPRRFEGTAARAERPPRRFEGTAARSERPPRRFEGGAPRTERPPRRFEGTAARSERPPRRFEGRPSTADRPARRPFAGGSVRTQRSTGRPEPNERRGAGRVEFMNRGSAASSRPERGRRSGPPAGPRARAGRVEGPRVRRGERPTGPPRSARPESRTRPEARTRSRAPRGASGAEPALGPPKRPGGWKRAPDWNRPNAPRRGAGAPTRGKPRPGMGGRAQSRGSGRTRER